MRLSALFLRLGVFVLAAVISVLAARATVAVVEETSVVSVRETLIDRGYDWTSVLGDGLQVILEGEAPTEATRFRAISAAGSIVDASRVIDNMKVAESGNIAAPDFVIEILRNDSGVSLIGLIPAETDREQLAARITSIANGQPVTDLLESADYPVPDTWNDALNYALRALSMLPRSKISVAAKRVSVNAISDSAAEKARLETALSRNTPQGVRLAVQITAPRPVISPFTTDLPKMPTVSALTPVPQIAPKQKPRLWQPQQPLDFRARAPVCKRWVCRRAHGPKPSFNRSTQLRDLVAAR